MSDHVSDDLMQISAEPDTQCARDVWCKSRARLCEQPPGPKTGDPPGVLTGHPVLTATA